MVLTLSNALGVRSSDGDAVCTVSIRITSMTYGLGIDEPCSP
jgi:hypothetical protein